MADMGFNELVVRHILMHANDSSVGAINEALKFEWLDAVDKSEFFSRVFFTYVCGKSVLDLSILNQYSDVSYTAWLSSSPDEMIAYMSRVNDVASFVNYYNIWGSSVLCLENDALLFDKLVRSLYLKLENDRNKFFDLMKSLNIYDFIDNINLSFVSSHPEFKNDTKEAILSVKPFESTIICSSDFKRGYCKYCDNLDYTYEQMYDDSKKFYRTRNLFRKNSITDLESFYSSCISIYDIVSDIVLEVVDYDSNLEFLIEKYNKLMAKDIESSFSSLESEIRDIDSYYKIKRKLPDSCRVGNSISGLYSTRSIKKMFNSINYMDRYGFTLISYENRNLINEKVQNLYKFLIGSSVNCLFGLFVPDSLYSKLFGAKPDCLDRADYYYRGSDLYKFGLIGKYLNKYVCLDICDTGLDLASYERFNTVKCFNNEVKFFLMYLKSDNNINTLQSAIYDWQMFVNGDVLDIDVRYRQAKQDMGDKCRDNRQQLSVAELNALKDRLQHVLYDDTLSVL